MLSVLAGKLRLCRVWVKKTNRNIGHPVRRPSHLLVCARSMDGRLKIYVSRQDRKRLKHATSFKSPGRQHCLGSNGITSLKHVIMISATWLFMGNVAHIQVLMTTSTL